MQNVSMGVPVDTGSLQEQKRTSISYIIRYSNRNVYIYLSLNIYFLLPRLTYWLIRVEDGANQVTNATIGHCIARRS